MKSFFSIALLADATQICDRKIDLFELSHHLQTLGLAPHAFVLTSGSPLHPSAHQNLSFHPVPSHPCNFGADEFARQRIQELTDALIQELNQARRYDIYHAQDIISATALTMMQGMGFIDEFIYTVREVEPPDSPYLANCQAQALRAASQCFCLNDSHQKNLQARYGIQAEVMTMPARSRVQRRRLRDRQANLPPDWQSNPWQEMAYQHLLMYEQHMSRSTLLHYA